MVHRIWSWEENPAYEYLTWMMDEFHVTRKDIAAELNLSESLICRNFRHLADGSCSADTAKRLVIGLGRVLLRPILFRTDCSERLNVLTLVQTYEELHGMKPRDYSREFISYLYNGLDKDRKASLLNTALDMYCAQRGIAREYLDGTACAYLRAVQGFELDDDDMGDIALGYLLEEQHEEEELYRYFFPDEPYWQIQT